MSAFVCWDPMSEGEPGAEPDKSNQVPGARSVDDAAEMYAERCMDGNDPFDSITLKVRDPRGETHTVKVTVDYSPTFYAEVLP